MCAIICVPLLWVGCQGHPSSASPPYTGVTTYVGEVPEQKPTALQLTQETRSDPCLCSPSGYVFIAPYFGVTFKATHTFPSQAGGSIDYFDTLTITHPIFVINSSLLMQRGVVMHGGLDESYGHADP